MIIHIANDHAGKVAKDQVKFWLSDFHPEIDVIDHGCKFEDESVDYPDYANEVATIISKAELTTGQREYGILICGTGIGMSIAANKHERIRAAVCYDAVSSRLSREHNNANILCLGARMMEQWQLVGATKSFVETDFEGERHQKRIDKFLF